MTALVWDRTGEHYYETGVDRGILFLNDLAIPWNGLVSVAEKSGREAKPFYLDGVKHLHAQVLDAYEATLSAFTYPDLLDELMGVVQSTSGIHMHDQPAQLFHLSYRTRIGNDLKNTDFAYKIHVVYNVIASLNDTTYETLNDNVDPKPFEWDLSTVPKRVSGFRATSHVSIDSRDVDPTTLAHLEAQLYGNDSQDPSLPDLAALLAIT